MIHIKKNVEPELKRVKFNCDKKLHDKLDDYELTKLMNKSNFTLFLGKAGSGKSSLLISFLKTPTLFKSVFHTIFCFIPPNSRQSIKDSFFDKYLPADQLFDELTYDDLQSCYDVAQDNARENLKTLIILDDQQKYLKDPDIQKLLLHMVNNRRHASLSIWLCCQTYNSIPRQIRQGLNNLFVFKINKTEMTNIFTEQIELDDKMMRQVLKYVFKEPHDFMYINADTQRLFSNWHEIEIHDDE